MLSKKAQYAFKALMYMADKKENEPILIAEISKKKRIPLKFLENILLELKKAGILDSKKGKGGGYLLARHPEEISAGGVLRALDGSLTPVACVGDADARPCAECPDPASCRIRALMREVNDATTSILDATTLDQLTRGEHEPRRLTLQRYHI